MAPTVTSGNRRWLKVEKKELFDLEDEDEACILYQFALVPLLWVLFISDGLPLRFRMIEKEAGRQRRKSCAKISLLCIYYSRAHGKDDDPWWRFYNVGL